MSVEILIEKLEPAIKFLTRDINLPGISKEDMAQELRLLIFQNYYYNEDKTPGWWFQKCSWYIKNTIIRVQNSKKPLDNYISLNMLEDRSNEYGVDY